MIAPDRVSKLRKLVFHIGTSSSKIHSAVDEATNASHAGRWVHRSNLSCGEAISFVPQPEFAIGRGFARVVQDNLTEAFGHDTSAAWVLHAMHRTVDGGLHGAELETKIGIIGHHTVFHHQVVSVAEGLRTRNLTVHQTQVV